MSTGIPTLISASVPLLFGPTLGLSQTAVASLAWQAIVSCFMVLIVMMLPSIEVTAPLARAGTNSIESAVKVLSVIFPAACAR